MIGRIDVMGGICTQCNWKHHQPVDSGGVVVSRPVGSGELLVERMQ